MTVYFEYKYEDQAKLDLTISHAFDVPQSYAFPKSAVILDIATDDQIPGFNPLDKIQVTGLSQINAIDTNIHCNEYRDIIYKVIRAIKHVAPYSVSQFFTDDGFSVFMDLMKNGHAEVLAVPDTLKIIKVNSEILVRQIPMTFHYHNNNRVFAEDVVFTFDQSCLISSLSFALGDKAIADIVNKPERFASIEEKYQIIRFMELYKTAYCLKRIDFIESIFDDNALIIVGNVIKEDNTKDIEGIYMSMGEEKINYIRHTKKSYITNLRRVFDRNEFVNIQFEDNNVQKRNNPDDKIFGIQIAQYYHSSTYSDFGYLFLLVDLARIDTPKIYVRTWQPERNQDGSIYGIYDFKFD